MVLIIRCVLPHEYRFDQDDWHNDLRNLNDTIQQYFRLLNQAPPTLSRCRPHQPTGYQSRQTIALHANNVLECLQYKCNGNNYVYAQLQSRIGQQWKNDLMKQWNIRDHLTARETEKLQSIGGLADHVWSKFKSEFNKTWGNRVFASKGKTSIIRAIRTPNSGMIADVNLKSDSNKYDSRDRHPYTIYYMRECEIVSEGLDKLINSNEYVWIDLFGEKILVQYGGDKAKKGGYYDTIAIGGAKFSVKNSMIALYIPGNVTENNSNLYKCYQLMNYNKIEYWRTLSKNPCIISIVFYSVDDEKLLESRLVHSCVVCVKPSKQAMLNSYKSDNSYIIQPNIHSQLRLESKFVMDQFDFEWKLNKSPQKQKSNHRRNALAELNLWEKNYTRPTDLKVLSDIERQGSFNKRARSLATIYEYLTYLDCKFIK